ncbi:MAG: hypothetical protein ACK5O7_02840 [Holosporales bacterium]
MPLILFVLCSLSWICGTSEAHASRTTHPYPWSETVEIAPVKSVTSLGEVRDEMREFISQHRIDPDQVLFVSDWDQVISTYKDNKENLQEGDHTQDTLEDIHSDGIEFRVLTYRGHILQDHFCDTASIGKGCTHKNKCPVTRLTQKSLKMHDFLPVLQQDFPVKSLRYSAGLLTHGAAVPSSLDSYFHGRIAFAAKSKGDTLRNLLCHVLIEKNIHHIFFVDDRWDFIEDVIAAIDYYASNDQYIGQHKIRTLQCFQFSNKK